MELFWNFTESPDFKISYDNEFLLQPDSDDMQIAGSASSFSFVSCQKSCGYLTEMRQACTSLWQGTKLKLEADPSICIWFESG